MKYAVKPENRNAVHTIKWNYENDRELVALVYLANHLRASGVTKMELVMPYIPNARQDRVKRAEDIFTLKYFAQMINSLGFDKVRVLDPHSNVSAALIDNLEVKTPYLYITEAFSRIVILEKNAYSIDDMEQIYRDLVLFYPDEGAMKRYSEEKNLVAPYSFGIKKRDWKTGEILGLDVMNGEIVKDKTVLIIDDICSKGGTFYHSAKALKELGAKNVYLYVTHCENSILNGDLIKSGLIKKVFTSDSLITVQHPLIDVIKL
jgi:ribose-phosphate pyrophosphokinase